MRRMKKPKEDAELNITSFMNLMIVLVPVLLLNMVFTQTMVLDIKLPAGPSPQDNKKKEVNVDFELNVLKDGLLFNVNKTPVCRFPKVDGKHNFKGLSKALRDYKKVAELKMNEKRPEFDEEGKKTEYRNKTDILLLLEEEEEYQVIVSAMDTLRSYPTVVVTSVEHAELLPDVSLGQVPAGLNEVFASISVEGCVK